MYEVYDSDLNKSKHKVEIFSTSKIIGEKGIDLKEESTIKSK